MKVKNKFGLLALLLLIVGVTLSACSSAASSPQPTPSPLRIGVSPWIGYGSLYIAQDKGFFAKEGVAVDVVNFDTYDGLNTALASRSIDGGATSLSDIVAQVAAKVPVQVVWQFDESAGGDVVVGNDSIKTPADLKGKRIALSYGTFGHVFVLTALAKYGISPSDVTIINLNPEAVPDALAAGKIDAGHTWDPFLTQALKNGFHPIFTSKDTPGIIEDIIAFRSEATTNRTKDVQAAMRAVADGLAYWKQNPDDANQIVAKAISVAPGDIPSLLTGVHVLTLPEMQAAFDTSNPKSDYQSVQTISGFFVKANVIAQAPDPQSVINPAFVQAVTANSTASNLQASNQ